MPPLDNNGPGVIKTLITTVVVFSLLLAGMFVLSLAVNTVWRVAKLGWSLL